MVNNVGSFSVSIYPNPVKDQLQVQVTSDCKLMLQVQVVSQDGKVVMVDTWNVQEGTTTQKLNVSALQSGSYILKVASLNPPSGGREAVKFEKL